MQDNIFDDLPTIEEYKACIAHDIEPIQQQWSVPKYKCPKCNEGGMRMDRSIVLTSNPPKFLYKCNKCGHIEYL